MKECLKGLVVKVEITFLHPVLCHSSRLNFSSVNTITSNVTSHIVI